MDGNSRWAVEQGLTVAAGHREGTRALRRTVEAAIDLGIESLTVYAFSTENWLRPPSEVDELMEIFAETIQRELPDLAEQGVRTRFVGRRDRVSPELRVQMADLEDETAHRDRLTSGSPSTTADGPSWRMRPGESSRKVSRPRRSTSRCSAGICTRQSFPIRIS